MAYRQMPPDMMWYQGQMDDMYDPMIEEDDEQDLAMLYPNLYHRVMPLVMYHGDRMEMNYGTMYTPTREEVGRITDDIYDRMQRNMNFDEYENEDESRQGPRRRRFARDLISILFLRDLNRRRRRRRRRMHFHGGY